MNALLVTVGDPATPTGGYLYHRRMAEAAPTHGASLGFASFPARSFPASTLAGRSVWQRMRDLDPDVVVVDSIAAWALAPWKSRLDRVPVAAMIHQPPGGIEGPVLRRRLQASLDRATYRSASLLMVASRSLEEVFDGVRAPRQRVELVAPGRDVADPDTVIDREELRCGRRRAFLCVANWLPRKGILELLEAFVRLDDDLATLHLVGHTSADARYGARVGRTLGGSNLSARVVVHGVLPKERVAAMYRAADVFVLPSFVEPYGTVYGEAMAFGLPVVGWHAGNLPYLARHEREGLIVRPGAVDALTEALRRVAVDDELAARLGASAARRAAALPTWEQTAARFFSCLRQLG